MSVNLHYNPLDGVIAGRSATVRRLSDLRGVFGDTAAYEQALRSADPILYAVTNVDDHNEAGDLHYGLGILMPGKVGDEYYMTKGHLHAWRPAAEVYIGLRGRGMMLLEDERTGECSAVSLEANCVVYVPGHTAHRTVNTGTEPLVYWGIFPSNAGHDYGAISERNFRQVVVEVDGQPVVMERADYLKRVSGYVTRSIPDAKPPVGQVTRPWGSFSQYAFNEETTVSLMTVQAGQRLSLQSHTGRAELWIVLDDGCEVQVDDTILHPRAGDEIWIPANARHRLASRGPAVRVLEVAFGNWQQADITRYADDYARPPEGE